MAYIRQLFCTLFTQHEFVTKYKRDEDGKVERIYLECLTCQKQTEGWRL